MLGWLGRVAVARRRLILAASGVILIAAVLVLRRGGALSSGGTEGIESQTAQRLVERELAYPGDSSFMALFTSRSLTVDDSRFMDALHAALEPLRSDPRVRFILAPDDAPPPIAQRLTSPDRRSALAVVTLRDDFPQAAAYYPELHDRIRSDVLSASFTGNLPFRADLDHILEHDLLIAELISLPLAVGVLLLVFRTLVAAAISVGVGALAVVTGIAAVTALSRVVDIAVYAVNVASLIGLGVAIDYSLFILSRYRDELDDGASYGDALVRALETAGKAVAFSGLAVGIGLGSLLFFRGSFLATMGLPRRSSSHWLSSMRSRFCRHCSRRSAQPSMPAGFRSHTSALSRAPGGASRPGSCAGRSSSCYRHSPCCCRSAGRFSASTMAAADVETLPRAAEARATYEALRVAFPDQTRRRILAVVRFPSAPVLNAERMGALYDLSRRVRGWPGVVGVESIVDIDPDMTRDDYQDLAETPEASLPPAARRMLEMVVGQSIVLMSVLTDAPPASKEARSIVQALRNERRVEDGTLLVTGPTAHDLDVTEFILGRAPRAIAFIVVTTYLVLFLMLRSVFLPLKAVVMNLFSIVASFGALVWIFQEGHLAHLLQFQPGPLDPTLPVLLFCAVFGLSMDYEVLMLSRMKEEYERTGDNTWAVAEGLEHTGRLVTSAAAIMVAVFGAFALARVVVVKAMGVGSPWRWRSTRPWCAY